ncbi:hypothetical protein BME96_04390 [Virgibacillus halodenitrificans]|uniref:Uncharacterized protein n=1 Tax=Virgibacillus halodenitrificans TaxID=1482 RepID=A0AAC9NJH4_VIRHA|nr:hypothetical protein [Virgibacillus halodenitrificans]APC47452.1 hypothetical protein BME96_04390 [Virgibacillus halodenitrificans]
MIRKMDILRRNCKYCKLLFLKGTLLKYILIRFDGHLSPLISITDERFPPAWLQPLPPLRSVQGFQAHAIPAGVVGQQDVGHAIVATGRGVLRLPSFIPINWYVLLSD